MPRSLWPHNRTEVLNLRKLGQMGPILTQGQGSPQKLPPLLSREEMLWTSRAPKPSRTQGKPELPAQVTAHITATSTEYTEASMWDGKGHPSTTRDPHSLPRLPSEEVAGLVSRALPPCSPLCILICRHCTHSTLPADITGRTRTGNGTMGHLRSGLLSPPTALTSLCIWPISHQGQEKGWQQIQIRPLEGTPEG
jgi:hypothetical protein